MLIYRTLYNAKMVLGHCTNTFFKYTVFSYPYNYARPVNERRQVKGTLLLDLVDDHSTSSALRSSLGDTRLRTA